MTELAGTQINGAIVPNDSASQYATHIAQYGYGGHRTVATLPDLYLITTDRREEGMTAWVSSVSAEYRLIGGISDSNWQLVTVSGTISGDYASTSYVELVSSNLAQSIGDLSSIVNATFNSMGSVLSDTVHVNIDQNIYSITHTEITGASYPLVSLVVPSMSSTLYIQGIYNTTNTGFDVVLSGLPSVTGYYINWQRGAPGLIQVISGTAPTSGSLTVTGLDVSLEGVKTLNFDGPGVVAVSSNGLDGITITISGGGSSEPSAPAYDVMSFSVSSSNILTPDQLVMDASLFTSMDVSINGYGKIMLPTNMQNGQSINILMTQDTAPYDWGMDYDTNLEFPMGVPVIPSSGSASTSVVTILKIRNRYFATGLTEFI